MCDKCGVDHPEYVVENDPLAVALSTSSNTLASETVVAILQVMIGELFIRTKPGDFMKDWKVFNKRVKAMFNEKGSSQPEVLAEMVRERDLLVKKVEERENEEFTAEGEAGLSELFTEYGVAAEDDEVHGNYL